VCCWFFIVAPFNHGKVASFYVSPAGNDSWSGLLDKPNASKTDGPFVTIQKARDAICKMKKKQGGKLKQPVTVYLREGTFSLTEPLVFGPEDSGSPECPITYQAYQDEKPVISGGRRITGFERVNVEGKWLWAVEIPEVREGKWYFHQLWVNGQRRCRARRPDFGFLRIAGLPDLDPKGGYRQTHGRFEYAPGDIKNWENLSDVDIVVLHFWVAPRYGIKSLDEEKRLVHLVPPSVRKLTDSFTNEPAAYYVENAFELLDTYGEWYLNRKTGMLYYCRQMNEDMSKVKVIAPVVEQLVRLEGKPQEDKFVEHLTFKGLKLCHSDWWLPREVAGDFQAGHMIPGAVYGEGVRHCVFEECRIAHISNYAIELARGCQHNRIAGCQLYDLGAGGIKIGEAQQQKNPADQTHHTEIVDCRIGDGGAITHHGVGILLRQSYNNRIAYNDIHDFYYSGITLGWTWGFGKTLAHHNIVEFNHIHHIGRGLLSDMGGVYTLGVQPGTVIRKNLFHDIESWNYGGWGIYLDEGSSHILVENNIVYRTSHGGFHQHYGKNNLIRNNIFAYSSKHKVNTTRVQKELNYTFEKNIVYKDWGSLLNCDWSGLNFGYDHNLYWLTDDGQFRMGNMSFEQWQAKDKDVHSKIADPLFVDAGKFDFRLKSDSPVFKLGFKPISIDHVGPRKR